MTFAVRPGMLPFMPAPPNCADRPLQVAGNRTRKLIGRAVALRSTGAITPSTAQCAGTSAVAATHRGGASVSDDTGSPIADGGIALPSLAATQSASVTTLLAPGGDVWPAASVPS